MGLSKKWLDLGQDLHFIVENSTWKQSDWVWICNRDRDAFFAFYSLALSLCWIVISDKYADGSYITHMTIEMLCVRMCHCTGKVDSFRDTHACVRMCVFNLAEGVVASTIPNPLCGGSLEMTCLISLLSFEISTFHLSHRHVFCAIYTALKWVLNNFSLALIVMQTPTTTCAPLLFPVQFSHPSIVSWNNDQTRWYYYR